MANTVSVEKVGNEIFFKTAPVFQYNEGNQYLELIGFDLPSSYRVDFSNYIDSQQSISMIGGTAGVVIPSELLATGSTVYAFYVDVDSDATTTLYRIEIPVVRRPEPSDREPSPEEQSAISQLMNDVGDLRSDLGDLNDLQTTAKNNLVAAINEAAQSGGGGGSVTVDSALSTTSQNPVQNRVITNALNEKVDSSDLAAVATSGSYNDLSNKPTIPSISGLQTQAITDAGGYFSTDTVEAALQQLGGDVEDKQDKTAEVTVSTSGAVTQALEAGKIYHFTSTALTSLTVTLTATTELPQYHFDFISPSTAATLTLPSTVNLPSTLTVEANKRYEIDILNNYGVVQSWDWSAA